MNLRIYKQGWEVGKLLARWSNVVVRIIHVCIILLEHMIFTDHLLLTQTYK